MAEEKKEAFLHRWSRLKQVEKKAPAPQEEKPAPSLPPVDKLTPASDFTGFMHPKVEDALRRVALKKLFNDPHFNAPDPFEPFSGDWTGGEAISEEMLKALNQARTHLFNDNDKKENGPQPQEEEKTQAAEAAKEDEPRRQDT
jgi:hypothetical protein